MDLEDIRRLCTDETITITKHTFERIRQRGIKYSYIKNTILNGEIIEQYPDDYPYPSCLIFAVINDNIYIHVVVGISNDRLYIITAYYPTLEKWEDDYRTRKAVK